LVGQAAVRRFAAEGWDVVAVSRRPPAGVPGGVRFVALDLLDADACRAFAAEHGSGTTHLVYAALQEAPGLFAGWVDDEVIDRNAAMLANLVDPLVEAADLQHVSLLHGTKAYGFHHPDVGMANLRVPLREREPVPPHRNFYFEQQRHLEALQGRHPFGLTTFRPTVIWGDATGANMNPALPIAVWAALLRAEGEPLHFPGLGDGLALSEAVDADLVADALVWAATSEAAVDGTYNLTNGDVFRWLDVWPAIAAALGMEPGEHRPTSLGTELPARADAWRALADEHGLAGPRDVTELCGANSLVYVDFVLAGRSGGPPILNSTIAARLAGFTACADTEDVLVRLFRGLADERLIPPP
jgi:nucleoside-diphosphate-sugar epimerase